MSLAPVIPLHPIPKNLRIVILNAPYDTLKNPEAQSLLGATLALKLDGYRRSYPYGVLPVDSYDFISTHHLVCEEKNGSLIPLMGYRSVTLEAAKVFKMPFPGLAVVRSSGAKRHEAVLLRLIEEADNAKRPITYGSSWTISPQVTSGSAFRQHMKHLMTTMLVGYELGAGIEERFCCGVPAMKSDRFFQEVGYTRIEEDGDPLPPFSQASLLGEEAVLLRCRTFSDKALEIADAHHEFWANRIVIDEGTAAREEIRKTA